MAASAKQAGDIARWILKDNPKAELIVKAQVRWRRPGGGAVPGTPAGCTVLVR
jgi:hypothetical protein